MILIFSDKITPRQQYIFDFFFRDILGTACTLTEDAAQYTAFAGPKLCYGNQSPDEGLLFRPEGLLHESGLRAKPPQIFSWDERQGAFPVSGPSALPFDPFAFSFYLVTRYEEYQPFEADLHGRFPSGASMAVRHGFLDKPVVNILARQVQGMISARFPKYLWPETQWSFIPTFDIDIAFAHLAKGWPRAVAAWAKLILKFDFARLRERAATLAGKQPDPYYNFSFQRKILEKTGLQPVFFFLLGDFGLYDRNNPPDHPRMKELVEQISRDYPTGIHPSYRSYMDPDRLRVELRRFAGMTGTRAEKSRQHFLRLSFPSTYRNLILAGIRHDYSMGYSDANGFRAGTCTPFRFYDLHQELETTLVVHPFIFMDSAFIEQLHTRPDEALAVMKELTDKVSRYGGEASGIWHNYALSGKGEFAGWETVFTQMMDYAAERTR